MKTLLISLLVLGSSMAFAKSSKTLEEPSAGLSCTMSYSSTDALNSDTDSISKWMVVGSELAGSAVSADKRGGWTATPAHYIKVDQKGGTWTVIILNNKKSPVGSFSFPEKEGMKATLATEAYMANESEDPPKYNKLEVSCHYTYFAG